MVVRGAIVVASSIARVTGHGIDMMENKSRWAASMAMAERSVCRALHGALLVGLKNIMSA